MPIQSTDRETTITFDNPYDVWTIKAGVAVAVSGSTAFGVNVNKDSATLDNYGAITSSDGVEVNTVSFCYVVNEAGATVTGYNDAIRVIGGNFDTVANSGSVHGRYIGVTLDSSTGANLINTGSIDSGYIGVRSFQSDAIVNNSGTIVSGDTGVLLSTGSSGSSNTFDLNNSGLISAPAHSDALLLDFSCAYTVTVRNSGRIEGDIDLTLDTAAAAITNTGTMTGAIVLGSGADRYDGRGGTLVGRLSGGEGGDTLLGGVGDDTLAGGGARDRLDGGKGGGEDVFAYTSVKDSRPSSPDLIAKHWGAEDAIDLSAIDANTGAGGVQHLSFGGAVAAGASLTEGVVGYYKQGGDTFVVFDNTGDGQADFKLQIHGTFNLTADEFVL